MRARGVLFAGTAALMVLASPAHAVTILDGVRTTQFSYTGSLDEPVLVAARAQPGDPASRAARPSPADCEQSSCNVAEVLLQLPRGRDTGTFQFSVVSQPLEPDTPPGYADLVAYGIYDAKGVERGYWAPGENPPPTDRPIDMIRQFRPLTASEPVVVGRLSAGRYTLVVFNLGSPTTFSASVSWRANPASRRTP